MRKLNIEELTIRSFVTAIDATSLQTCKGGDTGDDKTKDKPSTYKFGCDVGTEYPKCQWA